MQYSVNSDPSSSSKGRQAQGILRDTVTFTYTALILQSILVYEFRITSVTRD